MLTLSSLSPKHAIHCPTVEQYVDIRTQMMLAGWENLPKHEAWTDNAANTCILHDGKVTFLGYCQHKKHIIVSAAELIAVTEPDWGYDDVSGFVNDRDVILDNLFYGIAIISMGVGSIWTAIKKVFTRRRKINL